MATFAALSLGLLVLAPQPQGEKQKDPRLSSVLRSGDVNNLKKKTSEWVNARIKFDADDSRSNAKKLRKTREAHRKAWQKKSGKRDLLKHMADMLAVFDGVFAYPRRSSAGGFKNISETPKGLGQTLHYGLVPPKGYRRERTYRCVAVLPGTDGGKWADSKKYFEKTWFKTPITADTFFFIPKLRDGDDYDKVPDLTKPLELDAEKERIRSVLMPLGEINRQYNLDRTKMILDCGKGTSGWGIRLATYFPSRFAALVLRAPADLGKLQLESLTGVPIYLIHAPEDKAAMDKLKAKLEAAKADVIIEQGTGPYPFQGDQAKIDAWVAKVQRQSFPKKVVIAPNIEFFGKAYWINIIQMEPLDTVADDERPLLTAVADREKNEVKVDCRSVTSFFLYLNDALVDLDKEVTLVINGRATKHKFRRRIEVMVDELITAYDPTHLYTVRYKATVPKKEKTKEGADKGGKAGK